jgi:GNAT superfamily N-acetyltransferase
MTAALEITVAGEQDVPLIRQLIAELAEYERLSDEVVTSEEGLHDAMFGERRFVEALIARVGNEPVGFALFFQNFSTFMGRPGIYLEDLFVRPSARGRGIGKSLLQRLAAIAVERGCGRLEWTVLDWNDSAIAFYNALGARSMEGWTINRLQGESLERLSRGAG